jgi:putative phage-type endonuclease
VYFGSTQATLSRRKSAHKSAYKNGVKYTTAFKIMSGGNYDIILVEELEINNIEQPAQKTPEWYDFRNNLLTASNAYKIFESQSQQNSLIYEKCVTKIHENNNVNIESSLHWGQKYEPLSILIYENIYKTTIKEYGCLRHEKYSFIGASPDGINVDMSSNRFGRLLEVKNIVNREITGIPKKEYWIQMQLQMETFNIDECDFLETKFIEYTDELEFLRDSDDNIFISREGERKGIILFFSDKLSGKPIYIYSNMACHIIIILMDLIFIMKVIKSNIMKI